MENYKYYCEKCNYGTHFKNCIEAHNKSTLHLTGQRKKREVIKKEKKGRTIVSCEECDFKTTNVCNMLSHKLNHHSSIEDRKKKFKYYCDVCDFGAFAETIYNNHFMTQKHKNFVKRKNMQI
jgi:hypothetical protein